MRCFKCGKDMVVEGIGVVHNGTFCEGGHSACSRVYDSLVNGIFIRIVICDNCLKENIDSILHLRRKDEKPLEELLM